MLLISGPEELVVVKTLFSPIIFRIGKLFARLSYSLPDLILTMSESMLRIIQKNYSPSVPIYGLPIGVNPDIFIEFKKTECRKKLIREKIPFRT